MRPEQRMIAYVRTLLLTSTGLVLLGAAAFSTGLHLGVLHWLFDDDVQIEGGSGSVQASLGNAFADFTAGVASPEDATELTEPVQPISTETTTVEDMTETKPLEEVPKTPPQETREDRPEEITTSEPVDIVEPVELETTPDLNVASEIASSVVPADPVLPSTLQTIETAQPQPAEIVEATEENTSAVSRSLRPKPRTPEFEKKHEPPPPEPRTQVAQPRPTPQPQPRGNADQTTTTGNATGAQQRSTTATTGTGTTSQAGNAAISNYPGQVMRRISRVSRPRVGNTGTAVIAFSIGSNGGLASLSVARSSGSARLDQAALTVIRRAAPFPVPPPGARRNFTIQIKGR